MERAALLARHEDRRAQTLPALRGSCEKRAYAARQGTEDVDAAQGKVLCTQGDTAGEFFVILEGEVEVTKDGNRVGTLGPGDFFGEIALIERSRRTATVTAKTPVRFFALTGRAFSALFDRSPCVERKVLRALARRVLGSDDPTA